ncbi:MreC Cell shape-determining protein [Methylophilaceae bacterium]
MARHLYNKIEQQQAPAFFVRGPSPFARLAFFSVLSLALMAADTRLQYLVSLRQSLQTLLHPLQLLANAPTQLYLNTSEYFSARNILLSENQQLKKRDLMQSIALQKLNLLAVENAHLHVLLAAQNSLKESSVAAEIMYVGRDPFARKVQINRGQNHKILPGMAVVDAAGVIGQVTRVYPLSSEVTLITDTSLAMPVQIERNGLRAIAFGHGRDSNLDLPYLPTNVDIKRGDRLVTSGIDGVYPAGLAVATVKQIVSGTDKPYARIVCEPAGGVENHRQVLVVSKPQLDSITTPSITEPVKLGLNQATRSDKMQKMTNKSAKPSDAHAH